MVVRDRLQEMQQASKHTTIQAYDTKKGEGEDTELMPLKAKDNNSFYEFLNIVEEIGLGIEEVKNNLDQMKICQKKILTEPSKVEREKLQAKHGDLVEVNKNLGRKVQKTIKEETEKISKIEKKGKMTSQEFNELRLRKTQIQTASSRFLELWTEYNNSQVEFREKIKTGLARDIKITNNNLSQEEIEERIDKGDISMFSQSIIQETAAAKDQLVAIENRHQEILKLEAGIVEIHSMFIDLSNMVSMQGEMVDRIEDHINAAVIDVEKGRGDLASAEKSKKAATKKKFILGALLIIVILIILLVILSEFGAFSGDSSSSSSETIVKHEYIYVLPDGTKVMSDHERPDLKQQTETVHLGSSSPTTSTPTSSDLPDMSDYYDTGP